jgi:uncharacterized membrane protein YvbJ
MIIKTTNNIKINKRIKEKRRMSSLKTNMKWAVYRLVCIIIIMIIILLGTSTTKKDIETPVLLIGLTRIIDQLRSYFVINDRI